MENYSSLILFYTKKKERENENEIIWKCVEYNTKKCRGRLHSSGQNVVHTSILLNITV